MSRQINHIDHKLTEDERQYYIQRGRRAEIMVNDRLFGPDAESAPDELTWDEYVDQMTVPELKDELDERELSTVGNKPELQARLREAGPED